MNIRNPKNYINSFWDWSILEGCFGDTRIRASDLDGIVERKGHFLAFETKKPGEEISEGQNRTLEALARQPKWTVVVLQGPKDDPHLLKQYLRQSRRWTEWQPTNLQDVRERCKLWFERANRGSRF